MIKVESQGEGQGATFMVQLPLLEVRSEEYCFDCSPLTPQREFAWAGEPPHATRSPSLLNGLRVLIVDDEIDTREFLVTALEQYGAKVTTAAEVGEAFQLLERLKPDVLVSDIGMPVEDGYALIHRLRALAPEQGGRIPAVALTAFAREEDRIQALRAGFQMHVPKPIEPMQLVAVVANLAGIK